MVPRVPDMSDQVRRTATAPDEPPATVQSPERPETATRRTSNSSTGVRSDYGRADMETSQASIRSDPQRQRPRPARLDYGSMRTESSGLQTVLPQNAQTLSPERIQMPRRPTAGRRMPSSAHPHRGEAFSVDDDPDEVELDLRLTRTNTAQGGTRDRERERERERTMRRQESSMRRRPVAQPPPLKTVESDEREEQAQTTGTDAVAAAAAAEHAENVEPSSEETLQEEEEEEETTPVPESDDEGDTSDAESFTLKDRQEAINETHPFGIRIWKPALYKKSRSVQRNAESDVHSAPGGNVNTTLFIFNVLWTLIFGWWLCLVAAAGGVVCMLLSVFNLPGCYDYGRVLINLSHYVFYPFGKYVKLEKEERYWDEDEGEGRSITDYERWQTGDIEEGRLFFGPTDLNRSLIGRRRDEVADENESLLGRQRRQSSPANERAGTKIKKRFFGRGDWNFGRIVFFLSFYFLITPCLFFVSAICWLMVFTIPMGKVTLLLFYHLRRHPLALSFHTDSHYSRAQSIERGSSGSSILLCTYRAVGIRYWKYTIDGTNIFLINLLALVVFAIFDYFVLYEALGIEIWLTNLGLIFVLALASIVPLAYFIGQAVASISAQSSMGVGATINAFFATIVEVFLYCVALKEGKSALVEGSIIGSIFAGILFLPGLSMCFGAIKRKTQRFNVKSAGVTSTMLLFAVIGAFSPTLFYQMYGSHEMKCHHCLELPPTDDPSVFGATRAPDRDCRRCYFSQTPAIRSRFYHEAVRPFIWFACVCLVLSYVVGLLFTLRTHAAVIWNNEPDEKKEVKVEQNARRPDGRERSVERQVSVAGQGGQESRDSTQRSSQGGTFNKDNVRDSQMYKRILNQSLRQAGISANSTVASKKLDDSTPTTPHMVPPKTPDGDPGILSSALKQRIQGLSAEDNRVLVQEIAEMAATAATVAARDATKAPRRASIMASTSYFAPRRPEVGSSSSKDTGGTRDTMREQHKHSVTGLERTETNLGLGFESDVQPTEAQQSGPESGGQESGGHDAPNWSRAKSATILLTATVAYAVIAEILVDTVDSILGSGNVDEKFLGITLFALVPNTTEFLNAIAFAMHGNVALSMEIGSSYALQVMLLQIPSVVLFSGIYGRYFVPSDPDTEVLRYTFTMIFPQWDMATVILGVFLMGWVVGEGKSNYFKGSTLIFTYLVMVVGFWFSGWEHVDTNNMDIHHTMPWSETHAFQQSFTTIGKGTSGFAY